MRENEKPNPKDYEYAGFRYELVDGAMEPKPGQHRTAGKEKHRRAALECYVADGGSPDDAVPTGLTDEEAVIGRIQKLLNKAGDKGVTPEEADSYRAKAQQMMLDHNLSSAAVERESGSTGRREQAMVEGGFYRWQRDLWDDVAKVNFCHYWSQAYWVKLEGVRRKYRSGGTYVTDTEVRRRRHALIGRTVNVRATEAMARYLEAAIERAVGERFPDNANEYRSETGSYREGIAYRLGQRIASGGARSSRRSGAMEKAHADANRAAKAGASTSTAVTVTALTKSEDEKNYDFKYGDGAWARRQRYRAEAAEEARRQREAYTAWAAANPEEAREREKKAEAKAEREARSASRERFGGVRHDGLFWAGVEAGEKISLDPQVDGGSASVRKIGRR